MIKPVLRTDEGGLYSPLKRGAKGVVFVLKSRGCLYQPLITNQGLTPNFLTRQKDYKRTASVYNQNRRRNKLAARTGRNVILLPIFPGCAWAIIDGRKKVEFRKLNIPVDIENVVIYSTSPEKKIVGSFSVSKITKATPEKLWQDFKDIGYVDKEFLFEYYSGFEK